MDKLEKAIDVFVKFAEGTESLPYEILPEKRYEKEFATKIVPLGRVPKLEEGFEHIGYDSVELRRKESKIFRNQLHRFIKENQITLPDTFFLDVKYNQVIAGGRTKPAINFAIWLKKNSPPEWDEEGEEEFQNMMSIVLNNKEDSLPEVF